MSVNGEMEVVPSKAFDTILVLDFGSGFPTESPQN